MVINQQNVVTSGFAKNILIRRLRTIFHSYAKLSQHFQTYAHSPDSCEPAQCILSTRCRGAVMRMQLSADTTRMEKEHAFGGERSIMARIGKNAALIIITILTLPFLGCDTALLVGGKTIGISSGRFIQTDGTVAKLYGFPFEQVWVACEQALTEMKASSLEKRRRIAAGSMTAVILGDKVSIKITYTGKEQTSVSILVGPAGNNALSGLIYERIANNLRKMLPQPPG